MGRLSGTRPSCQRDLERPTSGMKDGTKRATGACTALHDEYSG